MKNKQEEDPTNPSHYKGQKQPWEQMIDIWGKEAFVTHCEMTAFKYRMRMGKKANNPAAQDLAKAQWYEQKAEEYRERPSCKSNPTDFNKYVSVENLNLPLETISKGFLDTYEEPSNSETTDKHEPVAPLPEAVQVFERNFDNLENRLCNAVNNKLLGTFTAEGTISAHGHAAKFMSSLEPKKHYLAWDGNVYPKIYIQKINVNRL